MRGVIAGNRADATDSSRDPGSLRDLPADLEQGVLEFGRQVVEIG